MLPALRLIGLCKANLTSALLNKTGNAFVRRANNFGSPAKWEGTFLERWGHYWKNLYIDYKEVVVSVAKESKEHPLKALTYTLLLGVGYYFVKHNPDEESFRDELLRASARVMMVSQSTRNPVSANYTKWLEQCYNEGIVRYLNLGIFSLIWLSNFDKECSLYKAVCPYLKPRYITFHERVVDIGLLDTWYLLGSKMANYDVNEAEFDYSIGANDNMHNSKSQKMM